MVTPDQQLPASAGYWCQVAAHTVDDGQTFWLGAHPTTTPRLALRWLQHRVRDIIDQLDSPQAWLGRHWLEDQAEHEGALYALAHSQPYVFVLHDDGTCYEFSARPTEPFVESSPAHVELSQRTAVAHHSGSTW